MQKGESDACARTVLHVFLKNVSLNKLLHELSSMSSHWLPRRRAAGASAEVLAGQEVACKQGRGWVWGGVGGGGKKTLEALAAAFLPRGSESTYKGSGCREVA